LAEEAARIDLSGFGGVATAPAKVASKRRIASRFPYSDFSSLFNFL
jgi:hypothetical protein